MKFLLPFALAVVLVAVDGKVVPSSDVETQQTGTPSFQLPDYIRDAQTQIANLGTQIQEEFQHRFALPNQNELLNTLKEGGTSFSNNLQELMGRASEEFKNKAPEMENMWNNAKTKLNEALNKFATDTQTTEQVDQMRAKFNECVEAVLKESQNIANNVSENSEKVKEDFAKVTKQVVDMAVQASQNFRHQLQQAAHTPTEHLTPL